jgi:hypothetical protein
MSRSEDETAFPLLAVLSAICAVAAGISLALVLSGRPVNRDLIVAGLLGGGVAAAVLGCVAVIKERGWGRWTGGVAAIAGIGIAVAGYSKLPQAGQAPPREKAAEEGSADKKDDKSAGLINFEPKEAHA